jgi:aminomethyltransferase
MLDTLKRTPLYEEHVKAGAKMVPFAGYEMPVQYRGGILAEHRAVRQSAGVFDVSHMGELIVRGPGALDFVQFVTTNDASKLAEGQAQYSVICNEKGTALDDCIVYRLPDRYMIVVNASNRDKDREWIAQLTQEFDVELTDESDDIALLALQGPKAQEILARLTTTPLDAIKYYHFIEGTVADRIAIISRTGYTGEDGFELYIAAQDAVRVWHRLMEAGAGETLGPIGLGARDSLRLEMGYALYGNDLSENDTPLEAGLGWVVKLDKPDFIGKTALVLQKEKGVRKRLVGFLLKERGFPRHGYEVRFQGEPAGVVTSGTVSPMLDQGIGMAYIATEGSKAGSEIEIMVRDRPTRAEVVRPPFTLAVRSANRERSALAVLTISDGVAKGERPDRSGLALLEWVDANRYHAAGYETVPDRTERIAAVLLRWADSGEVDVILTTGGTGFTARDVTPEATRAVLEREAPGIAEALRTEGARSTPYAWLARGVAGIRGSTLIVNLPGSESGVRDGLRTLEVLLPHAVQLLRGESTQKHEWPHG